MMSRNPRYQHQYNNNNNNNRNRQFNTNDNYNQYNQHDDRTANIRNRLGSRKQKNQNKKYNNNPSRSNNTVNSRSQNNYKQNEQQTRKRAEDFFKVIIPNGNKYEQNYIKQLIKENLDDMDDEIIFYNYHIGQNNCTFYVNGHDKADALRSLSRRIKTLSGYNLIILTQPSPPPIIQMNENSLQLIKIAMSSQYNAQTDIMDLSKFCECTDLKNQGLYIMLNRPNILTNIVRLINENAPNTIGINLSDNKLYMIEPLKELSKLARLKALNLSKNNINDIQQLEHIKHLDLFELDLEGNPLINKYPSTATYVSAIRKLFPNLKTLDKEELPSVIGFDISVAENLPETKGSFIPDDSLKTFITGFLKEYFRMYDSESRQQLMVAYHDSATFTHSVTSNNNNLYKSNELILKESHNLHRLRDESLWIKYVKTSNVDIVSFLNKLPVTKHFLETFLVDIPFFSKDFINVVVNGLLQETYRTQNSFRSFCRTFFLVPQNNGFVIMNEMFMISPPSIKQINEQKQLIEKQSSTNVTNMVEQSMSTNSMFNQLQQQSPSTTAPAIALSDPILTGTNIIVNNNNQREEIIKKFQQETKMNRQFSIQCLEENGYNYALAFDVFLKLKQANALPPEAFINL